MPPGLAARLIADEPDLLTPMAESRLASIKAKPCPRCHGAMHPEIDAARPFTQDDPLPRMLAKCVDCGHTVDQQTGFVVAMGNPAKVEDPFAINGSHQS